MIKIVFFGTPSIALPSLEYLNSLKDVEVLAVVTQPDKPVGRGHKVKFPPLKEFAIKNDIPVFQPKSIRKESDIIKSLKSLSPDFFVTFAFGQILSQEVLDIPKFETINLHASLLPKYRGANPIQRAIINGDKQTGICTMITELGLDSGDICIKLPIKINDDMTCVDLYNVISKESPKLIYKTLIGLMDKSIKPMAQGESGITQAPKLTKEETLINWKKSAHDIHNLVRGIYTMPSAYFTHNGKIIKVLKTQILENDIAHNNSGNFGNISKEGIEVLCGRGSILLITVKPEGKGEMPATAWFNGIKNRG